MLHGWDGVRCLMSCARFLPDVVLCIQAKEFYFPLIRPHNILPYALSLSRAFLQTPGVLSCAFFSGVASVWPLSHKAEICEVLQRLLSFWQVLSFQPRNSGVLSEWSLGSWSPLLAQFGRTASSKKSWGSSIVFPFPNDGAHCALENFQHSRNCFIHFPRSICLVLA